MAQERILLIENPAFLAVDTGRIRIRREDHADAFVSPRDVAVLVLHHHTISLTVHTCQALLAAGAAILITDQVHLPCGLLLPTQANRLAPSRLKHQIKIQTTPLQAALWQALVQARIRTQSATLASMNLNGALRLERLIKEVEAGDVTHREGQAARHYWQHLFEDFKREKEGADDNINSRLNYGYAILRSLVARELVAAGLSPELGLGHKSAENPFNLADDFMEPFRFAVERQVKQCNTSLPLGSTTRREVAMFVESEIKLGKQSYRFNAAVRETIASYVRILETEQGQLVLPNG
jgi:CRISPR-associated protein Cas1